LISTLFFAFFKKDNSYPSIALVPYKRIINMTYNNNDNNNDEAVADALTAAVVNAKAEATLADAAWDTYQEKPININGLKDTRRDYEKRRKLMQTSIDANNRLDIAIKARLEHHIIQVEQQSIHIEVQNKSKRAKLADFDGRGSYLMMPGMDETRIIISNSLDNVSRINLLLTSKKMKNQYYAHRNNNNNIFAPTMYINPSRNEGNGRNMFFTNWRAKYRNRNNNGLNDRLPFFTHMVVNDLNEYNGYDYAFTVLQHHIKNDDCPMEFIQDLDLSSSPDSDDDVCANFPCNLSILVPNILHLNLSNTKFNNIIVQRGADMEYRNEILEVYTQHCNRLEKITWNNNYDYDTRHTHRYDKGCIQLNGYEMRGGNNAHHLSNIEMNDCIFVVLSNDRREQILPELFTPTVSIVENDAENDADNEVEDDGRFHPIADLNNHNDIFMFHYCCNGLERVSIKNARYRDYAEGQEMIRLLPQKVLIKFVRNAPRLRYFRSDLTQANIMMLRMEKPEIEFVSN
jgi:hypothetical protein